MENPEESMVEERQELMVSPSGGNPFLKKAYFLKPTLESSINEPHFELPLHRFSSLPTHFEPKKWPLNVAFHGWRYGLQAWKTWVVQMASVHQCTWKKAGIYEAIINSTYKIRKQTDLVYGLAEKWCCETNTFIFPWGEATITLEDVMVLGGYPVLGDSVSSTIESVELREIEEKLEEERKECYKDGIKKVSTSLWMSKFMNSGMDFEHEAFLVFWLSRYVFHDGCNAIHNRVFSIAIRLARGTRIALAPAVLASIYRDLGLFKSKIVASTQLKTGGAALEFILKSPFQLVQVWAWERFVQFRPLPNAINYGEPRMARWDKVCGLKVEHLRMVLDSAGGDFNWRPYAIAVDNWILPKYFAQKEKWVLVGPDSDDELQAFVRCLRVSELVGFGTVEQYLPHRVAMQFGYDQDLPCSVTRPNSNSDIAWIHYIVEIENVKLYLPRRLFKAHVSTNYVKWWKKSLSGVKGASVAAVPKKRKTKSVVPLPPGVPPKCNGMADGNFMDEDEITISEFLKHRKQHKNHEIMQNGESGKFSGQVQNLAYPNAEENCASTMKSSQDMVSVGVNECPSISSLFGKRLLELERQNIELKSRFKRFESVVAELKACNVLDQV